MWELICTIILGWFVGKDVEFAFSIADKYPLIAFGIFIYPIMKIFK